MEKFTKFIIEDGNLILGRVVYHKDLITDKSLVKGGGWFRFNLDKKECLLGGESFDLGRASMEDIKRAIVEGNVYTNKMCTYSIAGDFVFLYDRGSEIVRLN